MPASSPPTGPLPSCWVPCGSSPSPAKGWKIHTQSGSASGSSPSFLSSVSAPPPSLPHPPPHPGSPPAATTATHSSRMISQLSRRGSGSKLYPVSASHLIVQSKDPSDAYMNTSPYFIAELSALLGHRRHRITRCNKMRHPGHTAQASLPPPLCFVAPPPFVSPPPVSRRRGALRVLQFSAGEASRIGPKGWTTFPGEL